MGKMFAVIFICRKLFLRIAGKITKIRKCKNFVPNGIFRPLLNKRLKKKKKIPFGTLKLFYPK